MCPHTVKTDKFEVIFKLIDPTSGRCDLKCCYEAFELLVRNGSSFAADGRGGGVFTVKKILCRRNYRNFLAVLIEIKCRFGALIGIQICRNYPQSFCTLHPFVRHTRFNT